MDSCNEDSAKFCIHAEFARSSSDLDSYDEDTTLLSQARMLAKRNDRASMAWNLIIGLIITALSIVVVVQGVSLSKANTQIQQGLLSSSKLDPYVFMFVLSIYLADHSYSWLES